jgi:hypothetical protein
MPLQFISDYFLHFIRAAEKAALFILNHPNGQILIISTIID